MPILLRLDSSVDATKSRSRFLTNRFAEAWASRGDVFTVLSRDLHRNPVPHLSSVAQHWPRHLGGEADADGSARVVQARLLDELLGVDALVIGAPMYNYSMPSTLKSWIDMIHVPGLTAAFDSATQPMAGRPAVIISARGATYETGSPQAGWDHVVPPLQLVLGQGLGMEVHVVTVDRTLADRMPELDTELAEQSLAEAEAETLRLALAL